MEQFISNTEHIIYLVDNSDLKYKAYPIYFESKVMSFGYKTFFVLFFFSFFNIFYTQSFMCASSTSF